MNNPPILKLCASDIVLIGQSEAPRPIKVRQEIPSIIRLFKVASQYLNFAFLFSRAPSDEVYFVKCFFSKPVLGLLFYLEN